MKHKILIYYIHLPGQAGVSEVSIGVENMDGCAFEKLAQLSSATASVELVTLSQGLPESITTVAT